MVNIKFKKLHPDAIIPIYKTPGAAGADLHSVSNVVIIPGNVSLVDLGFSVSIPFGYEMQIRPRSGIAYNHRVTVLNSPGTIDSDYRGSVQVMLINLGPTTFYIKPGDRVAQAVVSQVPLTCFNEVEDLDETSRGPAGFGSTGI